uniref:RING-type E3 ubiquitin transferase BRCA1 n=1 Tax=Guillardia theta TaxID=55529 RepID=A0A7S4P6M7_GUITH|mmetsp:Transcript_44172/g.139359  ORF Transcript_44172/g.139359 Transcript_44172/m.139359 type:complete len:558 (+) Transcript_44172:136-1809(+)
MDSISNNRELRNAVEELIQETKCPICLDFLIDPRTAPCQHNFCEECICEYIKDNHSECPSCRTPGTNRRTLAKNNTLKTVTGITKKLAIALGMISPETETPREALWKARSVAGKRKKRGRPRQHAKQTVEDVANVDEGVNNNGLEKEHYHAAMLDVDESNNEVNGSYYDIDFGPSLEIPIEFHEENDVTGLSSAVSEKVGQHQEVVQLNAETMDAILISKASSDQSSRMEKNFRGNGDECDLSTTTDESENTPDKKSRITEGPNTMDGRRSALHATVTPATVKNPKKSHRASLSPGTPHATYIRYDGLSTLMTETPKRRSFVNDEVEPSSNCPRVPFRPVVAFTGMGRVEAMELRCIVHVLGGSCKEDVDSSVTHMICCVDESLLSIRTLKFCYAMLCGVELVSPVWLRRCQKAKAWLNPNDSEIVRGCTVGKRKHFGPLKRSEILSLMMHSSVDIFAPAKLGGKRFCLLDKSRMKNPDGSSLSKLLRLAGGEEVSEPSTAEEAKSLIVLVNSETCCDSALNRMRRLRAQLIKYGFVMDSISMFEVAEDYMQTYLLA